ncbi:putative cytochrome P450 139 [Mycobacterium shigaense]|uniref:Putative cytochrome P450 139 n=1 Tax=Mycobacterium shigaense TaxID=722731 RepID=A0A1Z4EHU8_9MYCO|nr:hypothetical protein [Mycobacterium shigaense]PRI14161.1 hypothetical protein B2J96_17260 [Mycobacterium shigaense]BAX92486.1 putative cytochrome P450 139 [Mycobacterium shigaense]
MPGSGSSIWGWVGILAFHTVKRLHRRIGAAMATTQMTMMLARLVARTTLGLPTSASAPPTSWHRARSRA